MLHCKVIMFSLLAALASCEPPVQGYNYQAPRSFNNNYNAPQNSYLPPSTGFSAPSNNYLPPTSYASSTGYSAPTAGHSAPSSGYSAPSSGYSAPSSGYSGTGSGSGFSSSGHDHGHDHGHGENEVPKSYEFGYSVKDAQSGNDYDRRESSDGNVVRGEYRVQLPDGRTQIVTYHADWQTGFHADVRYEGEARYPEPAVNNQQGYNYNTPNDFRGSLTGFQGNSYHKPSPAYGPPGYH